MNNVDVLNTNANISPLCTRGSFGFWWCELVRQKLVEDSMGEETITSSEVLSGLAITGLYGSL